MTESDEESADARIEALEDEVHDLEIALEELRNEVGSLREKIQKLELKSIRPGVQLQ
jgi:predicted  nucleic acid-binding Zn-ribbon protein